MLRKCLSLLTAVRFAGRLAAFLGFVVFLCVPSTAWAQVAPTLGQAQQFGALGNSAVTGSTGSGTAVTGDVGSYPTATITNFPPSTVVAPFTLHNSADGVVQQAHTDAKTAYDFLAAQSGTVLSDNMSTVGVLGPGVYSLGAADLPSSATLTLNGSGIFIFNVASTLTLNTSSVVTGSANPCNVYWRVGTSATLNGTSMIGTVISDASITVGGGTVSGRVLAGTGATGAVTMPGSGGNTIGGCSAALVAPTVAKAFSPASILAGGVSRLTITLSNPNAASIALNAAFTDTLPSGVKIAATPSPATTCGGTVTATAGGSTVTLSQAGSMIPSGFCTIAVNVTAPAAGSFINTIAAGALQTTSGNNAAPASATLTATCPVITLAPATVPAGKVGVAYSQQLTASGGAGTYVFTVLSGTLPAGLTLSSTGLLSGTPTTAASSTVVIQAADGNGCPGVITYVIVIAPATCPVITLAPATVPAGKVAVAYSQQLTASGGAGSYTFTVLSGTLPAGLTLSSTGLLSGTPTTAASSTVVIQAADGSGCPGVITYVIVIAPASCPVITVAPATLPAGTVGLAYSQQITASGGAGSYTFTVLSGTLPAGLTLSSTGLLSGTPTAAASSTVVIQAADGSGCPGVITYTITVATAVPTLPQAFAILLALGLMALGYVRLRGRARAE